MPEIIEIGKAAVIYVGKITNDAPVTTEGGLETWPAGTAVNNATITGQVREASDDGSPGTAVGASISLSNVASSSGHYSGTIPAATTLLLTAGEEYHVWVTGSSGELYEKLVYTAQYSEGK